MNLLKKLSAFKEFVEQDD